MPLPEVIPQSVLFGNPDKAEPKLSPDGTQYAYLANSDKGVLNVFVQQLGDAAAPSRCITNDTHRGIRMFEWAKNNKCVLYLQDADGDENWHIYAADLATGVVRDMTPFQGIRAETLKTDQKFPDEAIVGLNVRDRAAFDLYRLDLLTGALVFHTQNPGNVSQWLVDADFQIRGCVANDQKDGRKVLKVRDTEKDEWRDIASWPNEETVHFYRFTSDGAGIYVATSMAHGSGDARDTTRLVVLSAKDGREERELFFDARCDIDEVIFNDADHEVEAVVVDYDKQEWKVQNPRIAPDVSALLAACTGTMRITSRSTDDSTWIVADMRDNGSPRYFLYTRADKSVALLFLARPALEAYTLVNMTPHVISTSDGEHMVVLRTLPAGLEPANLPTVLLVHGGPWARDHWGWNAQAQWLSNRGYACLMVNFRASTG
jgi:dipeptidyl aminopeptidase/acylaminoacyl peptidase